MYTMTIAQMLEEGIKRGGNGRSLFDDDRVVTYPQLRNSADRIFCFLREKGICAGDTVAIVMPRSIDYVVAETACLLYGICAVLLDSGYPRERIDFSVKDSGAKLIIDEEFFHKALSFDAVLPQKEPVSEQTPALIFYTSGSTGRPKGVLHDQESISGCIGRQIEVMEPQKTDVIGAVASFAFAAHLADIVMALCSGASCILVPKNILLDPVKTAEFIERHGITQMYMQPKLIKLFRKKGNSLKRIGTGTEQVRQIAPDGYRLFNMYAMTETNILTSFEIDKAYNNTPLGTALKGVSTYILDKNGQPCDEGELCVTGHFFTEYIGLPEKTAQTKIKNPFYEEDGHEYMIRTGDLVRRLQDGNIIYTNRKDWMININGHRIESGEIENVLREAEGVKDAAVKSFEEQGRTYLCAFYTAEDDVKEADLLSFISDRLAPYMIPERMVRMDALPLNANGKLDRMSLTPPAAKTECIPPASKDEETALCLAKEIVGDIDFGVTDNLHALGMDSLNAVKLSIVLKQAGLDISTSDIIKNQNIRDILSKEHRMLWFVKEYDENMPVLVIASGIVALLPVLPIYRELSRSYNILLIEPIQDHYDKTLKGLKYDELITLFMDQIFQTVPDVQKIIGFMGFSFGGELAASLAHRFEELCGRKTFAILGDTSVQKKTEYPDGEITRDHLDNTKKRSKEKVDMFLAHANMINGFGYGEKYACYNGPVTFLVAGRDTTEEKASRKCQNAKERYANISFVPMKQYSHTDMFSRTELAPFYFKLIEDCRKSSS